METNVTCPVCSKEFSPSYITEHVNNCLNVGKQTCDTDDNDQSSRKRKLKSQSGWGFLMSKKSKLSHDSDAVPVITIDESDDSNLDADLAGAKGKSLILKNRPSTSVKPETKEQKVMKSAESVRADEKLPIDLSVPLAEHMRPICFENYIGQDKALGKDKMLWSLLQGDSIPSMILWGPPGCGKTTLAKIVAKRCRGKSQFVQLSATSSGVNDVKEVVKRAKNDVKMFKKRTILFLDEIHRFNKLQQDSLLPHIEDGTITLIGATTENPSFQVNNALLSRCRVIVLDKLDNEAVLTILMKAAEKLHVKVVDELSPIEDDEGVFIEKGALEFLAAICDGDARAALNGLQMTVQSQIAKSNQSETVLHFNGSNEESKENEKKAACINITTEHVKEGLQRSHIAYDKTVSTNDFTCIHFASPVALIQGEEHYNTISALHKSMRGSSDSAALYWLARMMEGGEEPLYIARRLIEFASEDVGLADPQALMLAVSTFQACHFLGRAESEKPLAECVVYLSRAPKSVEASFAYSKAKACIQNHEGPQPGVPLHLRNASNKFLKNLGYGKGYKYNPAFKGPVEQEYFPECLAGTNFFK